MRDTRPSWWDVVRDFAWRYRGAIAWIAGAGLLLVLLEYGYSWLGLKDASTVWAARLDWLRPLSFLAFLIAARLVLGTVVQQGRDVVVVSLPRGLDVLEKLGKAVGKSFTSYGPATRTWGGSTPSTTDTQPDGGPETPGPRPAEVGEESVQELTPRASRRVRLGITDRPAPEDGHEPILAIETPLAPARSYLLRVDISAETGGSNVVNPVDLPPQALQRIPQGGPLELYVYSEDVDLEETGAFRRRQEIPLTADYASPFVYVRFTTRRQAGLARLGVCFYYQNNLLQLFVISCRVAEDDQPWDGETPLRPGADDALRLDAADMEVLDETLAAHTLAAAARLALDELYRQKRLTIEQWRRLSKAQQTLRQLLGLAGDDQVQRWLAGEPLPRPLGNESRLVFSINPSLVEFEGYENPAVSITYEAQGGQIVVKAGTQPLPPCHVADGLSETLVLFRQHVERIMEPAPLVYGFQHEGQNNHGDPKTLAAILPGLADLGLQTFDAVFTEPDVQEDLRRRLLRPVNLAISQTGAGEERIAWNGVYDLPLVREPHARLLGQQRTTCLKWADRSHQKQQPVGDGESQWHLDFNTCYDSGDCPRRQQPGESAEQAEERARLNVCVYGFWGFRHRVYQPPGEVPWAAADQPVTVTDHPPLVQQIPVERETVVNCLINTKIPQGGHVPRLEELSSVGPLAPRVTVAREAKGLLDALRDPATHVLYFFCHGGVEQGQPVVLVGQDDFSIIPVDLSTWSVRWPRRALVIINGCETAAYTPQAVASLTRKLISRQASGVIGTETKVFPELACWFGEEFLKRFLLGGRAADILLQLRLSLLYRHNPLGLVYTTHTFGGLQLVRSRPTPAAGPPDAGN